MHIPTLIIKCNVQSYLSLNASSLGEVASDAALSLPVAPDGSYFLSVLPLIPGFVGIARKIELSGGAVSFVGEGVDIICWPGGAIELMLTLDALPLAHQYEPASTISQHRLGTITATLFRESGIHLAIEKDIETLFSHTIAPRGIAKMEHARSDTGHLLYILVRDEDTTHCCCVRVREKMDVTYEASGDSFSRDGVLVTRTQSLASQRGYEHRETVDAMTGEVIKSEIGFFTHKGKPLESALETCTALLDAVRLGLQEDTKELLGGALQDLSFDDLRDFFGDYSAVALPPSHIGDSILLGVIPDSPISIARLFAFECENANGWRVTNASEI